MSSAMIVGRALSLAVRAAPKQTDLHEIPSYGVSRDGYVQFWRHRSNTTSMLPGHVVQVSPKALFMTVWRPSTRSAENSYGIRQG